MCGIFGYISPKNIERNKIKNLDDIINDMFFLNSLRGTHGAGFFQGTAADEGNPEIHKAAMPGIYFPYTQEVIAAIRKSKDKDFFVGHNRFATHGKKDESDNCHPFNEGDITLVHNGVLQSPYSINQKLFDVDSQAAAYSFNARDDWKETINHCEGAYAFVWYDNLNKTLNFYRNEQRPMYFIKATNGMTFFASEWEMLLLALNRNEHKTDITFDTKSIEALPVHVKKSYDVVNDVWLEDEQHTPVPVKHKSYFPSGNYNYKGNRWQSGYGWDNEYGSYAHTAKKDDKVIVLGNNNKKESTAEDKGKSSFISSVLKDNFGPAYAKFLPNTAYSYNNKKITLDDFYEDPLQAWDNTVLEPHKPVFFCMESYTKDNSEKGTVNTCTVYGHLLFGDDRIRVWGRTAEHVVNNIRNESILLVGKYTTSNPPYDKKEGESYQTYLYLPVIAASCVQDPLDVLDVVNTKEA